MRNGRRPRLAAVGRYGCAEHVLPGTRHSRHRSTPARKAPTDRASISARRKMSAGRPGWAVRTIPAPRLPAARSSSAPMTATWLIRVSNRRAVACYSVSTRPPAGAFGGWWCRDLTTGRKSSNFDEMHLGICSSPAVDGDRVYVVTNRNEVLCLDAKGMANGNGGPLLDERHYQVPAGHPPVEPGPQDADIIWRFDMTSSCRSFPTTPRQVPCSSTETYCSWVRPTASTTRCRPVLRRQFDRLGQEDRPALGRRR